jgi:hypothetical protein
MTAEDLAAYEEKIRERARERAVRAITLGPLVAGVVVLAVLALTVGSILALLGSGSGEGSAGACAASTTCKLASIDLGTELDPGSGEVQEYQAALDALGVKCTNPSGRLGDMAARSKELLAKGPQDRPPRAAALGCLRHDSSRGIVEGAPNDPRPPVRRLHALGLRARLRSGHGGARGAAGGGRCCD